MRTSDLSTAKNVLIRGTNWAGDTIISLPAAKEIRRLFAEAIITYWVPENVAPILRASAVCDRVITFSTESGGPFLRSFAMADRLKKECFDVVILFQNAFESAFTSYLARIPLRAGFPTDLRGSMLNVKIPFPRNIRNRHQAFYYLRIYEFMATFFPHHEKRTIQDPDCTIPLSSLQKKRALELVVGLGGDEGKPIFCLCPGSANSQAKRWPQEYFAEVADVLTDAHQAQVVYCGAPDERDLIEDIIGRQRRKCGINLAGRMDIMGMTALMSASRMVISNDTGSAHLAAAASTDVITLFGPTSPGATAPLGRRSLTLSGSASCVPCRHFKCPDPAHPCMRSLPPRLVLENIERILALESQ